MPTHITHGAHAPILDAPKLAIDPAAVLTAGNKDEARELGSGAGFRGQGKADDVNSPGTMVPGQPAIAASTTMNSREIAKLTGKEHKHVMADIRSMLGQLGLTSADFLANLPDGYGRPQPAFHLPKDLTITLVSGYSVPVRHRIVTRWQQLERDAVPALPDFTNPVAAARAWIEQFEQCQRLEASSRQQAEELAIAAPKAAGLDRIATASEGAVNVRVAAMIAGVPEGACIDFLIDQRWLYRQGSGKWLHGYADKVQAGLAEMKRFEVPRTDAPPKVVARVLITQRGLAKLAEMIERKAGLLRKAKATTDSQQAQLTLPIAPADAQEGSAP